MHKEVFAKLMQAVKEGKVSQEQLDSSVRRILEAKERFSILTPMFLENPPNLEHHALALELARKAITLLKDDAPLLPLQPDEPLLVIETVAAKGLGTLLGARTLEIKLDPDASVIPVALNMARDAHKIVMTTTDAGLYAGQVKLVMELLTINPHIIVVSVRTPYDATVLPLVPTILAAYGGNPPSLHAIVDVLMGRVEVSGVLPVALP
jgi:beta-N-acetylhexosaminidase